MKTLLIGLDKWLTAMWQIVNCKNDISSYEAHRAIGITQKSAWFMDHRIRLALGDNGSTKMSGHVEVDESFIGGKAHNMHMDVKKRRITGSGGILNHMPRLTECLISIELANGLRTVVDALGLDVPKGALNMHCPKCLQPVKPHAASDTQGAHFEHLARNKDCPLSDV